MKLGKAGPIAAFKSFTKKQNPSPRAKKNIRKT